MKIEKNGNANQTNDQERVNQSDAPWLAWLNIALDAYQEDERSRVDRLKHDIASDPDDEILDRYQQERDFRKPSTLRKVGRVALDVMRIHPQSSEQRRDREAMDLAISEYDAEAESQRQWRDWVQKKQAVSERLQQEEEKDRKEAEALERDMVEAMDVTRQRSHELTIGQRNQEIIEREINSRLLTVDKLEEEVLSSSHEVSKGVIDYDGAQIPIYHLKGIPFSMLSHAVDFRRPSWQNEGHIGVGTSKALFNDPSIWSEHEGDALADKSYVYDDYNTRGNLISVSSDIDQYGIVQSSQKFDGQVSRKLPFLVTCQSFGLPFSLYGAMTFFRIFTSSRLNVHWLLLVANQMSSSPFFQFSLAPRPFSRCHVIRFLTLRYFGKIRPITMLVCQSQQT